MATILVVDDTAVDRRLAGGLLESSANLDICYAEHGKEALQQINMRIPDLVLTDLQMPEIDGLELVNTIGDKYPEVPVVLMTAHGSEVVAAQALANGAASFVPKTDLADNLVQTVMHVLVLAASDSRYNKLLNCTRKTDFEFDLENDPTIIEPLIDMVQQVALSQGLLSPQNRVQLGVALEHALSNAMIRGNLQFSREEMPVTNLALVNQRAEQEPYNTRSVYFRSLVTREKAQFTIRDQGVGFDYQSFLESSAPESFRDGAGRGLVLIQTFMDEVEFAHDGREIRMSMSKTASPTRPR